MRHTDADAPRPEEPAAATRPTHSAHVATVAENAPGLFELQQQLEEMDVPAIVDELGRLDSVDRAAAFRLLDKDRAMEVFEDLDPPLQRELLDGLADSATAELFDGLDPDDRAALLPEVPAKVVARLLSGLSKRDRDLTVTLLGYPAKSAGRRMSPELVSVHQDFTVAQALERVRARGERAETIYVIPVVGAGRRVVGVVSLRRLLLSDPDTPVMELASEPVMVHALDDQEAAARVIRDNGMIAVPVVDREERLLGLLTVDDAMRVLEASEDEDAAFGGATAPLRRPYLSVGLATLVKTRVGWLLLLLAAATLTVNVLDHFQNMLDQVVTLALFVPLLIGTGGNAGAQSATTVVRALAVGDIRPAETLRVIGRELTTGLLLGLTLAGFGFVPAGLIFGWSLAFVVAVSVVAVCVLATTVGSTIPILASLVGVDPAVISAPLISTLVDATGLVVYFMVARAILGL